MQCWGDSRGRLMFLLTTAMMGCGLVAGEVRAQSPAGASGTTAPLSSGLGAGGYPVTGRVICADTQRPARFAQVSLIPAATDGEDGGGRGRRSSARTDLDGNFVIGDVPQGDYYVAGQLAGYVNVTQEVQAALSAGTDPGTTLAGVPVVHVGAGGGAAEVSLQRGGVLAGTVTWDDGSPAGGVQVSAQPAPTTGVQGTSATQAGTSGFGRNGPNGGPGGGFGGFGGGQTDDRGRFRLTGLLPGAYIVRATVQAPAPVRGGGRGYVPTLNVAVYAPNKFRRADAVPVTLAGSEEHDDVAIVLALAGLHDVTGTVSATGATVRSGSLSLTDQSDSSLNRTGVINADGSFALPYVPPGSYTLRVSASAQASGRGGPGQGSGATGPQFQPLQVSVTVVDADVTGLSLEVTPVTQTP